MRITIIPIAIIEMGLAVIEGCLHVVTGLLAILRVRLHRPYDYKRWLKRDLADCETILELGCGANSPILQIGYGKRTVAVDIFQPYVDMHNRLGNYWLCHPADILELPFGEKKFDAVVMLDVLEHLPCELVIARNLFARLEQCARKKVILFTPNGFIENDLVDGDPHQAHVSAWESNDYIQRGYIVKGATGWRRLFGKASLPKYRPYSVCAIIGMLSQPIVFNKPEWAWHSYAVKEIK